MLWQKSYHPTCLIGLYNRERAYLTSIEDEYKLDKSLREEIYPLAFSELLAYITETRRSDGPTDFRLAVLVNLFKQRLEQLGLGAIILARAAKVLRRHMLDHKSTFDGTFQEGCIQDAIPPTLLQFVGMIEHGADIKSQLRFGASKSDLTMAQLLQYNCYARYKERAATHRHSRERETPFPLYMGMAVFAKTRKR